MCYKCLLQLYVCRCWCAILVFMTIWFWSMAGGAFASVMFQSLTARVCILCTVSIIQYYLLFSLFFSVHLTHVRIARLQELRDFQHLFCYNSLISGKFLVFRQLVFAFFLQRNISLFQKLKQILTDIFTVVLKIHWNSNWKKQQFGKSQKIKNTANDLYSTQKCKVINNVIDFHRNSSSILLSLKVTKLSKKCIRYIWTNSISPLL